MTQFVTNNDTPTVNPVLSPPGFIPFSDIEVIQGFRFGDIVEGGGDGNAPGFFVFIDLSPDIISDIQNITITLQSPNGDLVSASTDENLEVVFFELPAQSVSGTFGIQSVRVDFAGDPQITGLPANGLQLLPDEISSLVSSRFVEIENPDQDITPPTINDLQLPFRSILISNDLPAFLGGNDNSVEISFLGDFTDDESGLNVIEFEFDIGDDFPAVIGAEIGLFGDLENGERQLSTFNTEAPAGRFVFELLRVSDDQGNTQILTADDLASLGFQNSVQVVSPDDLQDASSPDVSAFMLAGNTVSVGPEGGVLEFTFTATDEGFDATGVQSATLVLTNASGSRFQLDANVITTEGTDDGSATFVFPANFPSGEFTIERLSVNDAAFNRADLSSENPILTVINPLAGDVTNNQLVGDDSNNVIVSRAGNDTVIGGDGDDMIDLGDGDDTSFAGPGDTGSDTVFGGAGNDVIGAAAGDDLIVGGQFITFNLQSLLLRAFEQRLDGADTIFGGAGNDTIFGGSPRFTQNEDGDTVVTDFGSIAPNDLLGGTGNDLVVGSRGADKIFGGTGDDSLDGLGGNDTFFGGRGDDQDTGINDIITGGEGNDTVFASGGNDSVRGGADNDELFGGSGNDTIEADGGHDEIFGGTGDDLLSGGGGADTFFFRPGSGVDFITDFEINNDTLFLSQFASRFSNIEEIIANTTLANRDGFNGLLLDLGGGDEIFVVGLISASDLNIIF